MRRSSVLVVRNAAPATGVIVGAMLLLGLPAATAAMAQEPRSWSTRAPS
jgi:hypothetical protein